MKPDNLVIVRAGKNSLHPGWMEDRGNESPDFDLLVAAYDKEAMKDDTARIQYRFVPGSKVQGWNTVLREYGDLVSGYTRIALIDDDIDADTSTLNRCFAVGKAHDLSLWQPSLSHASFVTYGASLQNERFLLRHVNFVEMMCPFFKVSTLLQISPLFSLGFESGIDLIWCSIVRELGGTCAIVDACAVTHTEPVGGRKQLNGFVDKDYEDDIYRCLELFGMKWPSWVTEAGIDRTRNAKLDGVSLKFNSLRPLLKFYLAPRGSRLGRLKASFTHFRHQALRTPYYGADVLKRTNQLGMLD
ncbi:hypothetical protein [Paraburkholderia sp. J12]|uniref:hypothetical protein n=1 Tax=Paraburkholderia sp. J12 TaxID=2805432 RepID=UPI002ABE3876|nr:hypothetical protein [Paraburkholderia sp. J12]